MDNLLYKHGLFLTSLAKSYVASGKVYSKDTEVQRQLRDRAAKSARQKWRAGSWYIKQHKDYADV